MILILEIHRGNIDNHVPIGKVGTSRLVRLTPEGGSYFGGQVVGNTIEESLRGWAKLHASSVRAEMDTEEPDAPNLVRLWRICPDCGRDGAHNTYEDKAGDAVGTRCG